ncbi:AAA family ATPase [Lewinellaceae bacterium SD302]|nr:AAA family ATPase [Lewinellaceae bacterium SD302]
MQGIEETAAKSSPYKFRALRVYNSTEYLWDNLKKYRRVFDRDETAYIYAELSIFNKRFDQEDWTINVNLKCFQIEEKNRTEICHLNVEKEVSRYDNIVYIREGWGNSKVSSFWKQGVYVWEAYVDGKMIGNRSFYINERGTDDDDDFSDEPAGYLELQSVRLYEGPHDDLPDEERKYYRSFARKETRYVYLDLIFRNLQPHQAWHLELFTKFLNQPRELKGQVVRLQGIDEGQQTIRFSAGWGSTTPNLWREEKYTAEIIFMDKLLASIPFEVGNESVEGPPLVYIPGNDNPITLAPAEVDESSFETIMAKLNALIGLQEIKQQVSDHAIYLKFLQLRRDRGYVEDEPINVHSVFIGNPGTGKTTVAGMMGQLYKKMGLLSKGHVTVADRVDLVGEYIGQTAPKTREIIDKARGGVLFIDEAYSLARSNDDGKDFGREVIEILMKEMSNGAGDLAVIVAGYPDEMKRFLESNPGLRSRFKHNYEFRDFLPQELNVIANYSCEKKGVTLTAAAESKLNEIIVKAYRDRNRTFGNARFVDDLIEKAKINLGLRLMNRREQKQRIDTETLGIIELSDIEALDRSRRQDRPSIPIDEDLLNEGLKELDALIGLKAVKEQIRDLISLVRFYQNMGRDVLNAFHLHTVLIGNPGTGKTTVARILAKLYKALGILERGHMVETDRQGLVAGYVGQTAEKTAKKIEESKNGVLFIDEAYALTSKKAGQRGDFGDEAIQTLLKRMEDQRGEFFVFVAGYPDQMDDFLKANPGLSSRFDKILRFEDYDGDQLLEIADRMMKEHGLKPTPAARRKLQSYLRFLEKYRDKYFGNARAVRQLIDDIQKRYDLRRANMELESAKRASQLTLEDLEHLKENPESLSIQRKRIGF